MYLVLSAFTSRDIVIPNYFHKPTPTKFLQLNYPDIFFSFLKRASRNLVTIPHTVNSTAPAARHSTRPSVSCQFSAPRAAILATKQTGIEGSSLRVKRYTPVRHHYLQRVYLICCTSLSPLPYVHLWV